MRRLPLVLPLVLAFCAVLGAPALAAEKREVKEKNFTWTLPSEDWSFVEPDAAQKEIGYVLGAKSKDDRVRAWVRVAPANNLTAADLGEEVRRAMEQDLTKQGQALVGNGRLSGLAGSLVAIQGEKGGVAFWYRGWAVKHADTFHQLLIEAWDGAEKTLGTAIDELRRGYRLIEGAGPEEAAIDVVPLPKGDDAAPAGEDFPAGGPKKEGRTAVFPSHNLRWTLPEGSPFAWAQVTNDEKALDQLHISAAARQERKPEGDGDPKETTAKVRLVISQRRAGATPDALVNAANVQESFIKDLFNGKNDASKTKVDPSRKVGNYTGASFTLAGGEGKLVRYFIFISVMLRDRDYQWRVVLEGGKDVLSTWGKPLSALFEAVEFPNTLEPVSGPLAVAGIGALPSVRGTNLDKEIEQPLPGGSAKKPKGVTSVPWENGDSAQLMAWEARSADGMAYLFVDLRGWSLSDGQVAQKKLTEWVTERESQWRTGAGNEAVTLGKGKEPWQEGAWGSAKGLVYRFTGGGYAGHPFVEQGWVVKTKNNVVVLRAQFGGANAEKLMDAQWKAIKKGIKLN